MSDQENNAVLPGEAADNQSAGGDSPVSQSGFFLVEVRCPRERYIRAGIRFMRGKQTLENVPQSTLDILQADPCLIVVSVQSAAAPSGEAGCKTWLTLSIQAVM